MKIILFIIISFTLLSIPLFGFNNVYAVDCSPLKGQHGSQPSGVYNGNDCSILNQFNQITKCIGSGGYRYTVYYCNANGCEESYPEQGPGPNVPALCNRPDTVQSEFSKIFGKIDAPQAIQNFGFGGAGISKLLSNIIALIYIAAAIVLLFMILWGAWDWMTSEGDKEKLSSAQKKLINAFVGFVLFAAAFAIIQVLGQFTGFTFFSVQKP